MLTVSRAVCDELAQRCAAFKQVVQFCCCSRVATQLTRFPRTVEFVFLKVLSILDFDQPDERVNSSSISNCQPAGLVPFQDVFYE